MVPAARRKIRRAPQTLLAWRESLKLSQAEAGERVGLTQSDWSRLERGERFPRPKLAQRIVEETGVPLAAVLGIPDLKRTSA